MRLIDADALKTLRKCEIDEYADGWTFKELWEAEEADIDSLPTIDPVKHGHWEFIGGYGYQYRCSNCITCAERKTFYCPNCGSKMDESGVE